MDEGTFVYVVTGHPRRDKLKNMFRRAGAWIKDNQ